MAPADPNDPPKLVAAGQADVAISYQPQLHVQSRGGPAAHRIGTLVATPLNSLVVLEDGPIEEIADLKGARSASRSGASRRGSWRDARPSRSASTTSSSSTSTRLSPALLSGRGRRGDRRVSQFRAQPAGARRPARARLHPEEEGVPTYDELISIATTRSTTRASALPRCRERGVQYLVNHPDESLELFVKGQPELDDELNRRACRHPAALALRPGATDPALRPLGCSRPRVRRSPPPVASYAIERVR